jgi:predicted metal-dependent HD superfamily phosphohydrolase
MDLQQHWDHICRTIGLSFCRGSFPYLRSLYTRPNRHYHNLDHIAMGLHALEQFPKHLPEHQLIGLAYWLHDAIYDPRRTDNEKQSATLACSLLGNEVTKPVRGMITRLILVTRIGMVPISDPEQVMRDIDHVIFGQEWETYLAYEQAIRREYAFMPDVVFTKGRTRVLTGFLQAPKIFHTDHLSATHEKRARENLARAIERLHANPT